MGITGNDESGRFTHPTDEKKSDILFAVLSNNFGKGFNEDHPLFHTVTILKSILPGGKFPLNGAGQSPEKLRKLFREHKLLTKFFHEFPGMIDAILLHALPGGVTSKLAAKDRDEFFKTQISTSLFHNGPKTGFWRFFSSLIVKLPLQFPEQPPNTVGGMAIAQDAPCIPEEFEVFRDTPYEFVRERLGDDHTVTNEESSQSGYSFSYPPPTTPEAQLHRIFDRLSQGSWKGHDKILTELEASKSPKTMIVNDLIGLISKRTVRQIELAAEEIPDDYGPWKREILTPLANQSRARIRAIENQLKSIFIQDPGEILPTTANLDVKLDMEKLMLLRKKAHLKMIEHHSQLKVSGKKTQ
jgi:hypothetical protein